MAVPGTGTNRPQLNAHDYDFQVPRRAMVDSFVFQIDWTTVAMVVGLLLSLGAVLLYGGRGRE
jgi:hypothetical protein